MKSLSLTLSLLLIALPPMIRAQDEPAAFDHGHRAFDLILGDHVTEEGLVDYQRLAKSRAPLRAYLEQLGEVPEVIFYRWSPNQQLAFLYNLYNAATLDLILDHYPVKSIKSIGGLRNSPWDIRFIPLFGEEVSLNHVEHELIRGKYKEPGAHFALVCAAMSCPPLRNEAYVSSRLGEQVEDQARRFLGTPAKNRVDPKTGHLFLSPIFNWFRADFEQGGQTLVEFITPYFPEDQREQIGESAKIRWNFYDWSLNETGRALPETVPSGFQALLLSGLQYIELLGPAGGLIYIALYIIATVLLISGGMFTLAGGFLFGLVRGTIFVSIASTASAALAFLIGRYFARGWVEKKIERNESFQAVDAAVAGEGWKIVFLTRLSPVFPFVFLNYAYGLTKVKFPHYVLASWIGMLPGTIVYVWIGSLAGDLASSLAGGGGEASLAKTVMKVVGVIATIAVTAYVTKVARKALNERIGKPGPEPAEA